MHTKLVLTRHEDWAQRLTEYYTDLRAVGAKLDWEIFNCASFAGKAVEAVTGTNPYEEVGFEVFDSEVQTYAQIRRLGFTSLANVVETLFEEIPLAFAQRGDLALVPVWHPPGSARSGVGAEAHSLAVGVVDHGCVYVLNEYGLDTMYFDHHVRTFAVGREV